ncbi:hypothetical protein SAMN05421736_10774 [Evansella caseinilytica]|uniref:Uncharacterized protein n=1 Tax=Evansella caseinilytica TaxID=1503961 RepID=A0A1H3QVN5_9BACI|nr:hypothetical protein [Evansella caseinilytica]SDZ17497.1 hypothetical protein SAMN05421736_10774 [Evansella caseinilytica]
MKLWMTPICFLAIPVLYLIVGFLGFPQNGIIFWTGTAVLTLLGAYFTKHLPEVEESYS